MEPRIRTRQSFAETEHTASVIRRDVNETTGEWTEWRPEGGQSLNFTHMIPFNPRTSTCNDYSGSYDTDNELDIGHEATNPGRLDASSDYEYVPPPSEAGRFQTRSVVSYPVFYRHQPVPSEEAWRQRYEFVTKAAANTNPSRPVVDLAVLIGELRDLPSLFENTGNTLLKYGSNRYLQAQYGWRPLIKDLRSFMRQVNSVDKRMRALERLNKDKVLKLPYRNKDPEVTTSFNTGLLDDGGNDILPGCSPRIRCTTLSSTRRWATVYYKAEVPDNLVTLPSRDGLARVNNALYGGVVDGSTLWQLMPWSWLHDWTANVSTFLQAQRNVVGAKVTNVTLMETTSMITGAVLEGWDLVEGFSNPYSNFSRGSHETVSKKRIPGLVPSVVSSGEVDILHSSFKTSILTALAIQRLRFL